MLLLCTATETFYSIATITEIAARNKPKTPNEDLIDTPAETPKATSKATLECCICHEDCVNQSLARAKDEESVFLTDILSCKNPKNQHFYHKYCIITWIVKQNENLNLLKCPNCQWETPINISSLVNEEIILMMAGNASFYLEFLNLVYELLDSNILIFLICEDNTENQDFLKTSREKLQGLKNSSYKINCLLEKIKHSESNYKDEAKKDFEHVYYILNNPIYTMEDLLNEVEKNVANSPKHEEIIAFLLLNFFSRNNPDDFIPKLNAYAATSPHYWKIIKIVLDKFKSICLDQKKMEGSFYSILCSEQYLLLEHFDNNEQSKRLLRDIPLLDLLEKKISSLDKWVVNEQKCLAFSKSLNFCAKHVESAKLVSFLLRMINKCFSANVQNLKNQYVPKKEFMIDHIVDFYCYNQQNNTLEECPWFVYDFICAKILEEAPGLKSHFSNIFEFAVSSEAINKKAELKEYYFMNVLLGSGYMDGSLSTQLLNTSIANNDHENISMQLRHCSHRYDTVELFEIVYNHMPKMSAIEIFTRLVSHEELLNFENYLYLDKFNKMIYGKSIPDEQKYSKIGLWKFICEKQVDDYCRQCILAGEYRKIATLILGCSNFDVIRMVKEDAVEEIIASSDFFAHLSRLNYFFVLNDRSSLFVRHNFIKIFEMGYKKYGGISTARVQLFLKNLYIIGFNCSDSFKEYEHIFKYLSQKDDAFYLLNTGRNCFSKRFNLKMAVYMTNLIKQSHTFFVRKHTKLNRYKEAFDTYTSAINGISNGSCESWEFKCAVNWCEIMDKQDEYSKVWNPYMEMETGGTYMIEKMSNGCSSFSSFTSKLVAFIPRQVVNRMKEKLRSKCQK
ncbi:hypothetical protein ENBRE01_1125 [Enteropsectra breve]|nr:hypothetical protein ENBRE01_1125 [Enteropsectra breve]